MALSPDMKNLINNIAKEVLNIYNISVPICNIDEVVHKMGGIVIEDPELDSFSDGKIRKTGKNQFEIVVSPFQTVERKNFTIAHELGHLFLHMGFLVDDARWKLQDNKTYYRNGNSAFEYQSNEFAAAFLMPKEEYKAIMDKYTEDTTVYTAEIARYFHVSTEAASNRGKWLGYLEW